MERYHSYIKEGLFMNYALVLETSRKAKAAKHLYESLKHHNRNRKIVGEEIVGDFTVRDGIHIRQEDRFRVLNLRLQDEHLSPYFKSDMNLFQLLMIDETADMRVFRTDHGWLFVFEGVPTGPKPFGVQGHDLR
jgi:hypothetical protein